MITSCMINYGGVTVNGYTEEGCDASQERQMPAFTSIRTSGPFNVYYFQSDESKVLIEGKEEFLDKVITEIKDGDELSVKLEKGKYSNLVLKVTIFSPVADEINNSGSGNFTDIAGHVSNDDIEFSAAGSGDLFLANITSKDDIDVASAGSGNVFAEQIECKDFDLALAGSGDATIKGVKANNVDAAVAGSGNIKAEDAEINRDAEFTSSGSGDIKVNANIGGDLEVKLSGSGNATLDGTCNNLDVRISGSGDVKGNLSYNKITTKCTGSGKVKL